MCAEISGLELCAVTIKPPTVVFPEILNILSCKKVGDGAPGERLTVEFAEKPLIQGVYFPPQPEYAAIKLCRVEMFVI